MSTGFLKVIVGAEIAALVILYLLCVIIAVYGMIVPAIVWGFCATMMVEPWSLRWPKEETGTGIRE